MNSEKNDRTTNRPFTPLSDEDSRRIVGGCMLEDVLISGYSIRARRPSGESSVEHMWDVKKNSYG